MLVKKRVLNVYSMSTGIIQWQYNFAFFCDNDDHSFEPRTVRPTQNIGLGVFYNMAIL